jgi:CDP-diacylglycerol--glycerol-3-phosphate 3-phosphatidyltransferase
MRIPIRHFTTMSTDVVFPSQIKTLADKLDKTAPRFEFEAGQISIIQDPAQFYSTLKNKIANAKSRIFLSSLYIGKSQDEFIQCVSDAMEKKPDLKVFILTDALRATREAPSPSSASLLAQLLEKHGNQIDIRMYHTPHLNGIPKRIVPKRFNEGFGLQHMKIYGFDDEVILSGANLSTDYFTNRQDRYYLFKSKPFADYYFKIQNTIGSLSYKLYPSESASRFELLWPSTNPIDEPKKKNFGKFVQSSSKILKELIAEGVIYPSSPSSAKTLVYPVSQFTPLFDKDQSTEKKSIMNVLEYINQKDIHWTFTAGYFNMLPEIKSRLIESQSSGTVITASKLANGFYKSGGVSRFLPDAYLYLARTFLKDVHQAGRSNQINLKEWTRGVINTKGGWSYHAKGLWATSPGQSEPSITVIGSSNYTKRAYNYDLESNAIILTTDNELKKSMKQEIENLEKHTNSLELKDFEEKDRHIHPLVILATKILGKRL